MTHELSTNRRRALFWLAPLITAAICATAVSLLLDKTRKHDATRDLTADSGRLAALEEQLNRSNAALRRLELAQVIQAAAADQAEPSSARQATSTEQAAVNEAPPSEQAPATEDAPQAPYPEEREKAFFSAYFNELKAAMSQQRPDRQLAAQLMPLVPGVDRGLVQVLELSCTEQLCRLEARHQYADRAARDGFIRDLQNAFAPTLTRASIHVPTDEDRLLGYFAKKGATLPRPTTSFASFMRGDEG
jgi:hypothetical protein